MTEHRAPRTPRLTIELTQDLIESSKQRDSSHCMISEAVRNAFPNATHVSVDLQTIRFTDASKGRRYTYLTPRSAQIALIEFDQGETPEPFTFRIHGGQVTLSGSRQKRKALNSDGDLTAEDERNEKKKNAEKARMVKAQLVRGGADGTVAEKVGGRTPPTTPFARRRAFGLRALER